VAYRILIETVARRELRHLQHHQLYARIEATIDSLADDPRPPGCKKLTLDQGWRVRVGDYRIIYDIDDVVRIVSVERVVHRRDVYEE